jgi:tRNA 2-thiouridine synthesizing protein A
MAKTEFIPDETLDCSGLNCPIPIIKTAEAIKKIEVGQILQVISTDPGTLLDMEAWSLQTGHEIIYSRQRDASYIFYIRRTI